MTAFVVDVNVAIVANGQSLQADLECVSACVDALDHITHRGILVLDDGMDILSEYLRHLSPSGQPGLGDAFMQWVWEHQAVADKCERVPLTRVVGQPNAFAEFPVDPDLSAFDPADRMYVAVALASQQHPAVLNAVNPDWWQHRDALARNGMNVKFLCPQNMQ